VIWVVYAFVGLLDCVVLMLLWFDVGCLIDCLACCFVFANSVVANFYCCFKVCCLRLIWLFCAYSFALFDACCFC